MQINICMDSVFEEWFKDKTVSVVGNAMSLLDKDFGKDIDQQDVVIRINRSPGFFDSEDHSRTHGTKTDIWSVWNSADRTVRNKRSNLTGVKILHLYNEAQDQQLADAYLPVNLFLEARADLRKLGRGRCPWAPLPSSGFLLLRLLEKHQPSLVKIYGFDFKATASYGHKEIRTYPHRFDIEREWLEAHIFTDPRFQLLI